MSKVEIIVLNDSDLYNQSSYYFKRAVVGKVYKVVAGSEFFITRLHEKAIRLPVCKFKYTSKQACLYETMSVAANVAARLTEETNTDNISKIYIFVPTDPFKADAFHFCAVMEMFNE